MKSWKLENKPSEECVSNGLGIYFLFFYKALDKNERKERQDRDFQRALRSASIASSV